MTVVVKLTAECGAGHVAKVEVVGAVGEPHTAELLKHGESTKVSLYATRRIVVSEQAVVELPSDEVKAENAAPTGEPAQPE